MMQKEGDKEAKSLLEKYCPKSGKRYQHPTLSSKEFQFNKNSTETCYYKVVKIKTMREL